jgi:hypothetical protein
MIPKSWLRAKRDPLSLEHSKRRGKAIKRGMWAAKQARRSVLKAASRDRDKTRAEVAAWLLANRTEGAAPQKAVEAERASEIQS